MPGIQIKNINAKDEDLLKKFLLTIERSKKSFRYFKNRPLFIIENHITTILALIKGDKPVGYGHLDPEDTKVWLGICVSDRWQNKGIGKLLMSRLITEAKVHNLPTLYLTVDTENYTAAKLYRKFGFHQIDKREKLLYYRLDLE